MGVMKFIRTEQLAHGQSLARFSKEDKEAIRSLVRASDAEIECAREKLQPPPSAGGVSQGQVWHQTTYTGKLPGTSGLYLVIDTLLEIRQLVQVVQTPLGFSVATIMGRDFTPLGVFNRRSFHWFAFPGVTGNDREYIAKGLPLEGEDAEFGGS